GSARAQRVDGGTVLDIDQLTLRRGEERLELTSGRLRVAGGQIEAQRAQFAAGRGEDDLIGGAFEGSLDLDRQSGEISVPFFGGWPGGTIEHEGSLTASVTSPGGFPQVRAELDASGRAGDMEIDIDAQLGASGRGWNDMLGRLRIASLELRRGGETWQTGEVQLEGLLLNERLTLTWFDAAAAERSLARGSLDLG